MEFYREQLQGFSSRLLFSCSARECGSSSRWANQHFGVIQLHGLEQYQYYAVYEINHAQRAYYVTLYAVQRGNRRVYLQVRSEEHTSELQSRGHLVCRLLLEKK